MTTRLAHGSVLITFNSPFYFLSEHISPLLHQLISHLARSSYPYLNSVTRLTTFSFPTLIHALSFLATCILILIYSDTVDWFFSLQILFAAHLLPLKGPRPPHWNTNNYISQTCAESMSLMSPPRLVHPKNTPNALQGSDVCCSLKKHKQTKTVTRCNRVTRRYLSRDKIKITFHAVHLAGIDGLAYVYATRSNNMMQSDGDHFGFFSTSHQKHFSDVMWQDWSPGCFWSKILWVFFYFFKFSSGKSYFSLC